ncbi:AAA family ATPase [Spirillospora sp. NPDC048819]|uniref:AAA family ATPase n=1 Tax=Spirillospora sp. NPDC048819 TaxID=3155268 RepID=UPI0033D97126
MIELSDLVAARPGAHAQDPRKLIEFPCPSCERAEAAYWPEADTLSCPSRCDPGRIAALLRRGEPPPDLAFEKRVRAEVDRLRVRDEARRRWDEAEAAEFSSDWFGTTGDEFDPESAEQVPCVLEYAPGEFAFAPGVTFVFGPRSSAKTWLMYVAALQEARRGNRALLIDYEMSFEEAMRRMVTLGASREELGRVVYVQPAGPFGDAGRARLLARFGEEAPSVVVLDSVGMSMGSAGLDSDKGKDTEEWAYGLPLWLKKQWPDTVILLIDHVRKGEGASGTDPVGSQRKGSFADTLCLVVPMTPISRQRRGQGRLVLRKDRKGWGDEGRALLDFEFGGGGPFELSPPDPHTVATAGDPGEAAEALHRVARYVGEHEGAKVEEVRDALSIQPNEFTAMKAELIRQEVIEHRPRVGLFKGPRWGEYVSRED